MGVLRIGHAHHHLHSWKRNQGKHRHENDWEPDLMKREMYKYCSLRFLFSGNFFTINHLTWFMFH